MSSDISVRTQRSAPESLRAQAAASSRPASAASGPRTTRGSGSSSDGPRFWRFKKPIESLARYRDHEVRKVGSAALPERIPRGVIMNYGRGGAAGF